MNRNMAHKPKSKIEPTVEIIIGIVAWGLVFYTFFWAVLKCLEAYTQ